MKLYAQHGFQAGENLYDGLEQGFIDGIIISPKDCGLDKFIEVRDKIRSSNKPDVDIFFDPQFYANFHSSIDSARLGKLTSEEYSKAYFKTYRRSQLEDINVINQVLEDALNFQNGLELSGLIAPNVLITRSFDSIEAVIAKNFIRQAKKVANKISVDLPLYVTLAIGREAITDKRELIEFLNEITLLNDPPDGFYLLVAGRDSTAKFDIFNDDVIGGWMLLNHSLKVNGYKLINGYSDILTPILGVAGGDAGATGWWSNLRLFSLDRFNPASQGGGRRPLARYLSSGLLNRITYFELDQLRDKIPGVLNELKSDIFYSEESGSAPESRNEALQSWDAIKSICDAIIADNIEDSMHNMMNAINNAQRLYYEIQIKLDSKSNSDHIEPIRFGLRLFNDLAELNIVPNSS